MGTLYRYLHTTASTGADSTYKVAVTGSLYPLSIDQVGQRIYNIDSLPVGTDLSRVVFSSFSTSGVAAIRSLATDEDTVFTMTDSTDCSVERLLTVYAYDGVSTRTYRLQLNAHKEAADTFRWQRTLTHSTDVLALTAGQHVTGTANGPLIYGKSGGNAVVLSGGENGGSWATQTLPGGFATTSVIANRQRDTFYALIDGAPAVSSDGISWKTVDTDFRPDALIAAGTSVVTALKDGTYRSSYDGGVTWKEDNVDEPRQLAVSDLRGTVVPSIVDDQLEDLVVVGRTADGTMAVWRRTIDLSGNEDFDWYYLPAMSGDYLQCPDLATPSLFTYDGMTLLTGNEASGPAAIYASRDNGRTWMSGYLKALPLSTDESHHIVADADGAQYVWVLDAATGDLWRGRYNRLGWNEEQTAFERSRRK
jgi:hypothetical protein